MAAFRELFMDRHKKGSKDAAQKRHDESSSLLSLAGFKRNAKRMQPLSEERQRKMQVIRDELWLRSNRVLLSSGCQCNIVTGLGSIPASSHRVHTEWQLPLSGVHSILMEKLAQAGEGGGCMPMHPLLLYLPSHTKLQ
jgi:hypothetical protein